MNKKIIAILAVIIVVVVIAAAAISLGDKESESSFSLTSGTSVSSEDFNANTKFVNEDGGYTWTFDKNKGTGLTADSIDLSIVGSSDMSEYYKLLGAPEGVNGFVLDFGYEGTLPYEATVSYNIGKTFAGKALTLYHIDNGSAENMNQRPIVNNEGIVDIKITECSAYVLVEEYKITLPSGEGYTIILQGSETDYGNSSFSFQIDVSAEGIKEVIVKANGNLLTPVNGIYTISNITEDQIVVVELKSESSVDPTPVEPTQSTPKVGDKISYTMSRTTENLTMSGTITQEVIRVNEDGSFVWRNTTQYGIFPATTYDVTVPAGEYPNPYGDSEESVTPTYVEGYSIEHEGKTISVGKFEYVEIEDGVQTTIHMYVGLNDKIIYRVTASNSEGTNVTVDIKECTFFNI